MADQRDPTQVLSMLPELPTVQLALLVGAALVWLVGGNWVIATRLRRMGRPWWEAFKPGSFVFKHLGGRDWLLLAVLAAVALAFIILAVTVAAPPRA